MVFTYVSLISEAGILLAALRSRFRSILEEKILPVPVIIMYLTRVSRSISLKKDSKVRIMLIVKALYLAGRLRVIIRMRVALGADSG